MQIDDETAYRAVASRDRRFDGVFFTAVRSTGIYCRPSCPARTPRRENVTFHRTAASAQAAGFRACRRCLPDATPGSPTWDVAGDVAGRAMRLIGDGLVDREGVPGLARGLGYSTRQLNRILETELGAGPLALARAERARRARSLIGSTTLPLSDVAHAAGFASIRQFNATFREVYGVAPGALRASGADGSTSAAPAGEVEVRIPVRTPFAGAALLAFLARRAVPGVESVDGAAYLRSLRLPHGVGVVALELGDVTSGGGVHRVPCRLRLTDLRDAAAAVERCRRLLDADCDPTAVDVALAGSPRLRPSVQAQPGLRVPGHVDGAEMAFRAVLGQQVSVRSATALATRLVDLAGSTLPEELATPGVDRLFPEPADVAALAPDWFPGPQGRARTLTLLAEAVVAGDIRLDRSADRRETRERLLDLPGIGPWTADLVLMRALGDPDVLLGGDAGVRQALGGRAGTDTDTWRPWRSYAVVHLWTRPEATENRGES